MGKYDSLMDEYLEESGIDSARVLERTRAVLDGAERRRKRTRRRLKSLALASAVLSILSAACLRFLWGDWFWLNYRKDTPVAVHLAFVSDSRRALVNYGFGCSAILSLAFVVTLALILAKFRRDRARLQRVETSLPDPARIIKEALRSK